MTATTSQTGSPEAQASATSDCQGKAEAAAEGPIDLGGGCGGNCGGCGEGAGAPETARPEVQLQEIEPRSLARAAFVVGVLFGIGLTALVGVVLPEAMPFLAAAVLVIAAGAGVVTALRR